MENLAKSLSRVFVYDGAYSRYRGRRHGRPVEGLSAHRFLGYIQNHDQIGNRVTGDRLEHIVGMDRAAAAAGIVFTAPFIPMVFQGEEFAASTPFQYFADHDDPEMAKSVSEGRRRKFAAFGWSPDKIPDPEKMETLEGSKLNWSELHEGGHAEMLKWYRMLIHLRRTSSSLSDGDLGHRVLWNLSDKPAEFENPQHFHLLLASRDDIQVTMDKVLLPPDGLAILCGDTQ